LVYDSVDIRKLQRIKIRNILKSTSNYGFLSELVYAIFNLKKKIGI
jgi:ribosome biogenesis protein Nip4